MSDDDVLPDRGRLPRLSFVLEVLKSVRSRKAMYLQELTVRSAEDFLSGFRTGCFARGLAVAPEIHQRAMAERGWECSAALPSLQMRARGLSEEAIIDELFAIEIDCFERLAPSGDHGPTDATCEG